MARFCDLHSWLGQSAAVMGLSECESRPGCQLSIVYSSTIESNLSNFMSPLHYFAPFAPHHMLCLVK